MHNIIVTINNETTFKGVLYENETVNILEKQFPLNMTMNDLHNNEKYIGLGKNFPVDKKNVGEIQSGDLMLYGTDTLVLFYEDFSTPYSYTQLGYLTDTAHLKDIVGTDDIDVHIELA